MEKKDKPLSRVTVRAAEGSEPGTRGTDTGVQASKPGTETRVIFHIPYSSDTSEASMLRTKAMTRRLFRGRSRMIHGTTGRKSKRTVLS